MLYLRAAGWTDADTFSIITQAGEVTPTITGPNRVSMALGRASVTSPDYPGGPEDGIGTVQSAGREWAFRHVNVGNPQCVIEVGDELEELDLAAIGPAIESNTELFPNRTNVSFTRVEGSSVRARIFERGVGETLASGTGASGAAVAAFLDGAPSPLRVELDGGALEVEVSDELDLTLIGNAERVYAGELDRRAGRLARLLKTRRGARWPSLGRPTCASAWKSQPRRRPRKPRAARGRFELARTELLGPACSWDWAVMTWMKERI